MLRSDGFERREIADNKSAFCLEGTYLNLVRRNAETGEWAIVDKVEREVRTPELDRDYALWHDQKKLKGVFFREVVRKEDGQIQPDELISFPSYRKQVGGQDMGLFPTASGYPRLDYTISAVGHGDG